MTLHDTDVNDNIHDCVAPHDAYTCNHFHWASCAFSQSAYFCLHLHAHLHFGSSCLSPSLHLHVHGHLCVLFDLTLLFYFLLYLPPLFLFLTYMKSMVNLHNSCNEGVDSTDEFHLHTTGGIATPTRRYHGRTLIRPSTLRVPPMDQRCLHTRRFGTLAGPPSPVKPLPWWPHPPGQALVHFVIDRARLFTDHRISGLPIRAKFQHFRTIWEDIFDNSPTDFNSSSLKWWSSMQGVDTL